MCKFRLKYTYCQWKAVIDAAVKQLWRAQRQCTLPWKGMCKFWLKYTYCQWKAVIAATVKQLWRAQRQCTLPCGWFLYEEKVASPFLTWSRSMIVGVLHCRVGYSLEETGEDGLYKVSFGVLKSRYLFFVGCAESWRSREIIGHFSKTLQGAGHKAVRDQVECDAIKERCVGAFWRWRGDWCFRQTTTASHTAVKWSPALWNWPTLGPAPHQEHSEGAGADGRPAMHPTQDFKICSDFQVSWLNFILCRISLHAIKVLQLSV